MANYSIMGVVRVTWPIFKMLAINHIFAIGEARHFKFLVLFDTEEYYSACLCTFTTEMMCSGLRDLFKFWKRCKIET